MRLLILVVGCLLGGLSAHPGLCSQGSGWGGALGSALTSEATLTNLNLTKTFGKVLLFADAPCRTSRLPGSGSVLPVASAFIVYDEENACNRVTGLTLFEISVTGGAGDPEAVRLQAVLTAGLGRPCFAGDLAKDERRHAPIRHLIAWRSADRVVALGTEAGEADLSVSLLQTIPQTLPRSAQATEVRSSFLAGLPAACQ